MRARAAKARRAPSSSRLAARHDAAWRDPVTVAAQWADADAVDPRLLAHRARGDFWDILAERRITLLVTREYEHLLVALHAGRRGPTVSWLPLPHPNGLAVDPARGIVHVASTRNPNQLFELAPVTGLIGTRDRARRVAGRPLLPVRSRFLPGSLYLHDLAMIGGALHANGGGAERRDPLRARRRLDARLVAAIDRDRPPPALRSQLPAAQLDRRRADAGDGRTSRRPRPRQVPGARGTGTSRSTGAA